MSNTAPLTTRSNGSADSNPLQMAAARGKWRQWEDPIHPEKQNISLNIE